MWVHGGPGLYQALSLAPWDEPALSLKKEPGSERYSHVFKVPFPGPLSACQSVLPWVSLLQSESCSGLQGDTPRPLEPSLLLDTHRFTVHFPGRAHQCGRGGHTLWPHLFLSYSATFGPPGLSCQFPGLWSSVLIPRGCGGAWVRGCRPQLQQCSACLRVKNSKAERQDW